MPSALTLQPEQLVEELLVKQHQGDEALTQVIGQVACETGLEALIVPSARRTG